MKTTDKKPKAPRAPRSPKSGSAKLNQATAKEFEREGMGVAPKE